MNILGLKDSSLVKNKAYMGRWCEAQSKKTFQVENPATKETIGLVPDMHAEDAAIAIGIAHSTFEKWKVLTVDERGKYLKEWAILIRENADDLARIMTFEQGKPLAESKGEVIYSAGFLDWFAEESQRANGRMMPAHHAEQRFLINHEGLGTGAVITPWNFPALMILREVAAALAAGCTIVVKPSDLTPLTALALVELAVRAGLPPGVLSLITCSKESTPHIGALLTASPEIRKISFTGSTATGKLLAKAGAETLTRMSLELGGNAPFIVFEDADIEAAVKGLMASKFRNAGQACVATNRIYLQKSIYKKFLAAFMAKVKEIKVGYGWEDAVTMGPLVNESAVLKMEEFIEDALSKGGEILCGGKRHELGSNFYEPTVIVNAHSDMLPCQCEIFGPLALISTFHTEAEVLHLANDSIHGLAAYFYSNNRARCWRVSEALEAGIIGENTVAFSSARTPFGGYKQSGIGRDGGSEGLAEWQEIKYRCIGGLNEKE